MKISSQHIKAVFTNTYITILKFVFSR